jgi:hypothetical protein
LCSFESRPLIRHVLCFVFPFCREDLYAAVIHSLAMADRHDEAENLFLAMAVPPPGVKSFDAVLLSHIRSHSWEAAINLYGRMVGEEMDVTPGPQTIRGLLIAHHESGGRPAVLTMLDSLLSSSSSSSSGHARMDEGAFRLASKILFQEVGDSLEDFRQHVREIGERDATLRQASLSLVRSVRVAEIESGRLPTPHQKEEDMARVRDAAWTTATLHLLDLARATSAKEDNTLEALIVPRDAL